MSQLRDALQAVRGALLPSVVASQAGLLLYGLLDLALAGPLSMSGWITQGLAVLGLALPSGAALGMVMALALASLSGGQPALALRRWLGPAASPASAPSIVSFACSFAIFVLLAAGFMAFSVRAFHDIFLIALAVALACLIAGLIALTLFGVFRRWASWALGLWRPLSSPLLPLMLLPALGAAACLASQDLLQGTLALWARSLGQALLASMGTILLLRLAGPALAIPQALTRARRPLLWSSALALLLALGLPLSPSPHATFVPALERALRPLADLDQDGVSAILGGGDCKEMDSRLSPFAVEVPDNGLDEDCRYGDGRSLKDLPPPPKGVIMKHILLLTVAGLRAADKEVISPDLPFLRAIIKRSARFLRPVGMEGPLAHVAPALMNGRVAQAFYPDTSGFPTGGPSLPWLMDTAQSAALVSTVKGSALSAMTPLFLPQRSRWRAKTPAAAVEAGLDMLKPRPERIFLWVHLDLADQEPSLMDQAIKRLVAGFEAKVRDIQKPGEPLYRILVVGLAPDAPAGQAGPRAAPGGPLALLGPGIHPRAVKESVGLLDVYPTLLDYAGIWEKSGDWPEIPKMAGSSLRPLAEDKTSKKPPWTGAITAWMGSPAVFGAQDEGALALAKGRSIHLYPQKGQPEVLAEGDPKPPEEVAPLVELLRDRFLAPRLASRNSMIASARMKRPPEAMEGLTAEFGNALRSLGCLHRARPGRQMEVILFLQGGEHLDGQALLDYRLRCGNVGVMEGVMQPLDGAYPFGTWQKGEIIAQRLLIDLRPLPSGMANLWLGIRHQGRRLPITKAQGNIYSDYAEVCGIDI